MAQRNLVLFEAQRICPDALTFAREYCLRMERGAALLMLHPLPKANTATIAAKRNALRDLESSANEVLDSLSEQLTSSHIDVQTAVRIGDPEVELTKFLAESSPFGLVIWGSDMSLPNQTADGRRHWIISCAEELECPLYCVSSRE